MRIRRIEWVRSANPFNTREVPATVCVSGITIPSSSAAATAPPRNADVKSASTRRNKSFAKFLSGSRAALAAAISGPSMHPRGLNPWSSPRCQRLMADRQPGRAAGYISDSLQTPIKQASISHARTVTAGQPVHPEGGSNPADGLVAPDHSRKRLTCCIGQNVLASTGTLEMADPLLSGHQSGRGRMRAREVTDLRPMIARIIVQTTLSLSAMGAVLFLAAGDWRWAQGWVFLGELGLSSFAVSFWLLRHDPALLASRLSAPIRRDQMPWDRILMPAILVVFVAWLVLLGIDARRFGWSHVPLWAQALGAVLIALGMALVWQTFRFNTFAAPQVRVQADREHRVITDGPYRVVRHPCIRRANLVPRYAAAARLLVGVVVVPLLVAGIAPRAIGKSGCSAVNSQAITSTRNGSDFGEFRASGEKLRR